MTLLRGFGWGIEGSFGGGATSIRGYKLTSVSVNKEDGTIVEETIDDLLANVYFGRTRITGSFEGSFRYNSVVEPFYALFGKITTSGTEAPYTHTFDEFDTPKSMEFHLIESSTNMWEVEGVIPTSIEINCEAREIIKISGEYVAKEIVYTTPAVEPTYTDDTPLVFYNAKIYKDAGATDEITDVSSLTLSIERSIDDDYYVLGNAHLYGIKEDGGANISGTIRLTENNLEELRLALFGNRTGADTMNTNLPTTYLVGEAKSGDYGFKFSIPIVVYQTGGVELSGRDAVEREISFRVAKNTASTPFTMEIYNEVASY